MDWEEPPIPPEDLIFDDGEPLETYRHRKAMNVLIDSIEQAYQDREDFFVGGNMFIYFSRERVFNKDFRGPDFFVVLDIDGSYKRQGWVVWDENGRYPDVIVELMSDSTAKIDLTTKKDLYERTFRCSHYFVYHPFDATSLQGWALDQNQRYQEIIPDHRGWLWCQRLGLWLGVWTGSIQREDAPWLRFYDRDGNLILLPAELAEIERQNAEIERQNAELQRQNAEIERQRAEAESQRAEAESQRAEAESQRAEIERQNAEIERQRAENESQRAEIERQRAERLAARLRELGENPEF
jgi:Uma2 family endonuclease